ncbi:MAG TPA: M20/M25/M40 family metallo-hydrolase [Usitatibacter sp.]|jgi:acetylornithine deacetylase/succinyl-diaminopimelate desuccinylase-like protein|nr:M20/M25/M40 family metallo-hydrolase [Usitatibacter sp.]
MTARQPLNVPYNAAQLQGRIAKQWDGEILPQLIDYIRIPAKSPHFDAQWREAGHIEAAIQQARNWAMRQPITGLEVKVVRLEGRTPVLYFDAPATPGGSHHTVLLYGHLDKQPEMTGWRPGFGPWKPVVEEGRLYGRGGADDGYSIFAALAAILALDVQQVPRPRCVGLIETCEESGSYDLPAYLEALAPHMGSVGLVIALDSGAGNYDQLWITTSLRGLVNGTLEVKILEEGVHSGDAGGVVPSSFRIARQLLDRIDDSRTGLVKPGEFACEVPNERFDQARQAAQVLGESLWKRFPWATCCDEAGNRLFAQPVTEDPIELILNRTWRAALGVTGADGLPAIESAGNVQRPRTALKLSMRLPPLVNGEMAARAMKAILERDPPYKAHVTFEYDSAATGWNAPAIAPWLAQALDHASQALFSHPAAYMGEGGTIPFMSMLGEKFPQAQILVTGVLGPRSNAHGPNEFLDIAYAKKVTAATAMVVAALK